MRVLHLLLQHAGRSVAHEVFLKEAWGSFVSRHTVATTVTEVRKALAEYGSWIDYRPGFGYALMIPRSDDEIRKGWHLAERRTREGLEKALPCFQKAAADDPSDYRGWEGASRVYMMLGMYGARAPKDMHREFLDAQSHAIGIQGLTPDMRADRAHVLHIFERKWAEAEAELLLADQERPSATICIRLLQLYSGRQRFEEALHWLQRAHATDHLWRTLPANEVFFWLARRDFDLAIARGKEGLDLQPYLHLSRSNYAQALEFAGRSDEALAEFRLARTLAPDLTWLWALEGACLARRGKKAPANRIREELQAARKTTYVDAYYLAPLLAALGKRNEAFRELDRALEENSTALYMLDVDPRMDALRADRRFKRIHDAVSGQ